MSIFNISHKSPGSSRRAVLTTPHGDIQTPVFMPVGTSGAVKGITPQMLKETGTSVVLANTYHLFLRPGDVTVRDLGGLHKFMAWDGPILTDSGGYQIFSLNSLTRIDDDGVEFASHVDGAKIRLDPETATGIQHRLGADIIMCLDECTPYPCEQERLQKAVERTIRWAALCKQAHLHRCKPDTVCNPLLFGIVQGGTDKSLRIYCARELVSVGFDGYAIGGLSVGEGYDNMSKTVEHTASFLPADKPRYLMGAGTPADIISAVKAGVDMFDCVMPARNGRNAFAFTDNGPLRLRNSEHINDSRPIEDGCNCYCCTNFSRGAIRHFFNIGEMLGPILTSLHNIAFYQRLMNRIRVSIERGTFEEWASTELNKHIGYWNRQKNGCSQTIAN